MLLELPFISRMLFALLLLFMLFKLFVELLFELFPILAGVTAGE